MRTLGALFSVERNVAQQRCAADAPAGVGDGHISTAHLTKHSERGELLAASVVATQFKAIDVDSSGAISRDEFSQ